LIGRLKLVLWIALVAAVSACSSGPSDSQADEGSGSRVDLDIIIDYQSDSDLGNADVDIVSDSKADDVQGDADVDTLAETDENSPDSVPTDEIGANDLDLDAPDSDASDLDTPETQEPKDAEYWARAAIAGSVDVDQAFIQISHGTGFPIKCRDGNYLFLHRHFDGPWFVAGDFNNWQKQAMTKSGDDLWHIEVSIPNPIGSGYKFVKENTYEDTYIADPWARAHQYDEHGEISFVTAPQTAHLQRFRFLSGQGLEARDIRVYVPAMAGPWAVLYAHDGQNLFAPDAIGGGWKLREAMSAIQGNFLIVGVDNTDDRMEEYIHVDDKVLGRVWHAKGDAYADFIQKDVRPFVESHFATKDLRGLMGSSLGGLISLYIAHLYPDDYAFAASLSGTLAWGRFELDQPTMQQLYVEVGKRDFIVYVDSGGGEGSGCSTGPQDAHEDENERDNYCATRAFADALAAMGYEYQKDLYHWHEPGALHNEAAWAARVDKSLRIFKFLGENH
jgi:predicted alpha/beta superfamily hydrolase